MREPRNRKLIEAKLARDDEFYTRYEDVADEIEHYFRHDPAVFIGKRVYCPCDDWPHSQFINFFKSNFHRLGLEHLAATGIAGQCYTYDGREERVEQLENGSYRSPAATALRDASDVIVTNPPFSLYRDFYEWLRGKDFILVAPLHACWYKCTAADFVRGRFTPGATHRTGGFQFSTPTGMVTLGATMWITTLAHGVPPERLELRTMKELDAAGVEFRFYDHDPSSRSSSPFILDVPKLKDIPSDYRGLMGVPISFAQYYDPALFKIIRAECRAKIKGRYQFRRVIIRHRRKAQSA